jgi:predicted HicB family RNase H-like nuclease
MKAHPLPESKSKHMTFRTSQIVVDELQNRAKKEGKSVSRLIHDIVDASLKITDR